MSEFEVLTYEVRLTPHPDADNIEIAHVADYMSVTGKNQWKDGDVVAYIPEGAVVPDQLLKDMHLEGKLAGSKKNRVKAIRLRGVLSQGLVWGMPGHKVGEDVAELLGIVKYDPPIPATMQGQLERPQGSEPTYKYYVENIKKHPEMFEPGELVYITEKIHGTWCDFAWIRDPSSEEMRPMVSSLGLSKRGLALKINDQNKESNLYVKQFVAFQQNFDKTKKLLGDSHTFHILGEVYGSNVQDLSYGLTLPRFLSFDYVVDGELVAYDSPTYQALTDIWPSVPDLVGESVGFDRQLVDNLTNIIGGCSTLAFENETLQLGEGVVVKAVDPFNIDVKSGRRKTLKSISDQYLLRKGGTELT